MGSLMETRKCACCGQTFQPRPQARRQSFCSSPRCQRKRKTEWQRSKLQSDGDYRENQNRARNAWIRRHPEYWRRYRTNHPAYVARNKALQKKRNAFGSARPIAKMDASSSRPLVAPGMYELRPIAGGVIATMDVWTVEIRVHSCRSTAAGRVAKR